MKIDYQKLLEWLNKNKITFIIDFDISKRSWLKAGGKIKTFITPSTIDEIKNIVDFFKKENFPFNILGNISNTIIRDGTISTPIINLSKLNKIEKISNNNYLDINVGAGVVIPRFANFVMNQEYSGTEALLGIPGSIGGGVFMNASCYGDGLTNYIAQIHSIDLNGKIIERNKKDCQFKWRESIFQKNKEIIVGANFKFPISKRSNNNLIQIRKEKIKLHRNKIQENDYPNLGSLFATKDLYSDIKFTSFKLFFLFLYYKFILVLISNNFFKTSDTVTFRKKINKFYRKSLKLDENNYFTLSDKTINCLINKGSPESQNAIDLVNNLKRIVGKKVRLENIIFDNIK